MNHLKNSLGIVVFAFAFILYSQSISFNYAFDDETVTKSNRLVKQGLSAVPEIIKTDYWYGLGENLRGPIYRPATLILFAFEWQLFAESPFAFHFMNILLFALSSWLLFIVLCKLFNGQGLIFSFIATLFFVSHPIHTEVVDNIKSADEILCFLFALLAIFFSINALEKDKTKNIILASLCYFLSLASKETGIVFFVLIPLSLYVSNKNNFRKISGIVLSLLAVSVAFMMIRYKVLEAVPSNNLSSPINNSLLTAPDFISQKATAFYVLLRYIFLLFMPYSLSCDYSFPQIPTQSMSSLGALAGILIYVVIGIYAILNIRKKSIISFSILFFLVALAPVSNLFLLIGSPMAERFLYIPSLGFCIALTTLLMSLTKTNTLPKNINNQAQSLTEFYSSHSKILMFALIIVGLYSVKTLARSRDWKDNVSLFGHDVLVSDNSARLHYLWGNTLLNKCYPDEKDLNQKNALLDQSVAELKMAINRFPLDIAYRDLARCYGLKKEDEQSINTFRELRKIHKSLDSTDSYNLGAAYHNAGIQYLSQSKFSEALPMLDSAVVYHSNVAELHNDKGSALSGLARYQEASFEFKKAIDLNPKIESAYKNMGITMANLNDLPKALNYFLQAINCDSTDLDNYKYVGAVYHSLGNDAKAKEFSDKNLAHEQR